MLKRALTSFCLGAMLTAGIVVAPVVIGEGSAFAQQARQSTVQRAQIARIRAIVARNRNNPAALQSEIASYLSQKPAAARMMDEALTNGNVTPAITNAIGAGMAVAVNNLLASGGAAGTAVINSEIEVLARSETFGPTKRTACDGQENTLITQNNTRGPSGNQTAQQFTSLLNSGNGSCNASGSRSWTLHRRR